MTYDYIVAGGGGAGLSLVYRLLESGLTDAKILLIDRERKTQNDRTWCFWEETPGLFEGQLYDRWEHLWFYGANDMQRRMHIAPYTYKMLRGIDFYDTINRRIDAAPGVTRLFGDVEALRNVADGVAVTVSGEVYRGRWGFNSIPPRLDRSRPNYLDQHFKGWIVRTDAAVFDPDTATLMDFRIPQERETRFVYVMPFAPDRALVEFTVFGKQLLPDAAYDRHLRDYIARYLTTGNFRIEHEEYGIIPMTDQPLRQRDGRIFCLGTAGGRVKTSTGYAFQRMQATNAALVQQMLRNGGSPEGVRLPGAAHFRFFDSILLNVLVNERLSAKAAFTDMFRKNEPAEVLRFLSESSSLLESVKLFTTVPTLPFLRAFGAEGLAYLREPQPGRVAIG